MKRLRIWLYHKTFFFPFWVMDLCRCEGKTRKARGPCVAENVGWALYRFHHRTAWTLVHPPLPSKAHGYFAEAFGERKP